MINEHNKTLQYIIPNETDCLAKIRKAVKELADQGALPVIGPSVMEFEDMENLIDIGAQAVSFGTIHLADNPVWKKPWTIFTNPCKPTNFVLRERREL